jgi:hypothetical protein
MTNPYKGLPDHQFWRRGVSGVEHHLLDPIVAPRFRIAQTERVATAGSCFAQHISKRLASAGFNYFVTEDGAGLIEAERTTRNFGVFSARYGNLYTTAQLLQLFQEAFELRQPEEIAFQRPDGRFVDAFRQQVEPEGYATIEDVAHARHEHLAAVRRMFVECNVFVFTLGLTEAWRSTSDQSVYPIAPGVVGGAFDPARHAFVNFDLAAVEADLEAFLAELKRVNSSVRVLLTVSPVPLIATYEKRHVLVSTTYSKSVLRVAAEQAMRRHDWVDYFPSYEIITGSYAGGLYYEDDFREVNNLGVAHAMRCFMRNYTEGGVRRDTAAAEVAGNRTSDIVCDEEAIAATV